MVNIYFTILQVMYVAQLGVYFTTDLNKKVTHKWFDSMFFSFFFSFFVNKAE